MPPRPCIVCPVNETESGHVFGWRRSYTIVVAGSLQLGNDDNANIVLSRLNAEMMQKDQSFPPLELLGIRSFRESWSLLLPATWHEQIDLSDKTCLVYYRRPKNGSMRHYSLVGLKFDSLLSIRGSQRSTPLSGKQSRYQQCQFEFVKKTERPLGGIDPWAITCMNSAHRVMQRLRESTKKTGITDQPSQKWYLTSAIKSLFYSLQHWVQSLRARLFRPRWDGSWMIKNIVSVQQIDLRCEQLIFTLRQARLLDRVQETSNNETSVRYISAQNCVWLILNDMIIGYAVGVFLIDNRHNLSNMVQDGVMNCTVIAIRESIFWLDNWPAGLKLNTELSRFLFLLFSSLVDVWEVALDAIGRLLPTIIFSIGVTGILGMTMILALMSDLSSVLTTHLAISYAVVRVAFRTQLLMAKSLFNLFRGKRYNALRRRLDDWDYDLDQLLLGAILLTLVNFFFPTITVYYALYALSRLVILMFEAGIKVALALLNHFPLFAFTLRIKDPWRLPGGIIFRRYHPGQFDGEGFIIQNEPIAWSEIFEQYYALGSKLAAHYSPSRILADCIKGIRLDPIPQDSIRYTYDTDDAQ